CLSFMIYINPKLTLYAMLPLPMVTLLFYKFSSSISRRHLAVQEHLAKISSMVQENLAGIRVIHAYVQEEYEKRKFEELNREYLKKNMSLTQLFGLFTPSLVFFVGIAVLISLWLGAKAVIAEEMTLGSFVAFNGYLMMMSWPVMGIGYMFNLSQKGLTAMGRLEEILTVQPRVDSRPPRQTDREIQGEIEFRNLRFTYPGETGFGLRDINLKIPKGTRAALLGMVGAGKTTLVQLIPRIFDCQGGTLLIDGKPVRDIPLSNLRRGIGYVDQGPYLFSTSIKNNIAFGRGDAAEEDILQVVQIAALTPDISSFPQGLETLVGERGVSLSGGQKQRIALARALLRKPKILILDDAFSSLDVETEETILKNIGNYIRGMTTIIVTHRLSTIRHVDQIAVMENGEIIERGTHADLLQNGGYYHKVFKSQALAREMNIYMP
ncbi:MAG: ABC transporter ATP-binding protein, partial [Nitrospinales bacterium]